MPGKKLWTDEQLEALRQKYLDQVSSGGINGALRRATDVLGLSYAAARAALSRYVDKDKMMADVQARDDSRIGHSTNHDPADPALRQVERKVLAQQDELLAVRAKLKATDRESGIIASLVNVLRETIQPMIQSDRAPIFMSNPAKKGKQESVDAVVMMSDQHGDRVIRETGTWGLERYDFNIFRCRLWEWTKMIARYCTIHLPNYKFDTLWVWHLGDAVNGDIHNMKHRNTFGNSLKAAIAVGDVQAEALSYLSQHFKRVVVVCVSGNHGRTTQKMELEDPHDNFDYLVAQTMRMRLADHKNIEVFIPQAWSAHVEVRGWLWHLNHGNGVVGTWGIPWYGFEKREGRVQRLTSFTSDKPVDYFAYGHFHTPMTRPVGRGKAIHAGSWFFTDAYALNKLSVGNEPEQQLLVFSERFGRQMEIPLMVRDKNREQKFVAGDYDPPFGRNLVIDESGEPGGVGELPIIK